MKKVFDFEGTQAAKAKAQIRQLSVATPRTLTHVVMHTSASYNPSRGVLYPTASDIDRMHRARGWNGGGYHFVVGKDGNIEAGRPISRPGAHVEGFNQTTVGICVSGHGDYKDWTIEQKVSAAILVASILEANGLVETFKKNPMRVIGHAEVGALRKALAWMVRKALNWKRDFNIPHPHKSCPGKLVNMSEFRRLVLEAI